MRVAAMLLAMPLLAMGGCATTTEVPGETSLSKPTQERVVGHLKKVEHMLFSCSTLRLRVTDTKVLAPPKDDSFRERWTVHSCNNQQHAYEVESRVLPKVKGRVICSQLQPQDGATTASGRKVSTICTD